VDGGFDLTFAPVEGIEEGDGDRGVVLGGAVAHLIEGVTEGGVAVFGEVADAFGAVAGAVGDGVVSGEGPDLGGAVEAVDGADAGEVSGSVPFAQAGDGRDVAGGGVREEGDQASAAIFDEGFCGQVLVKEALELVGEGLGHFWGQEDGVVGPGAEDVEQGGAAICSR